VLDILKAPLRVPKTPTTSADPAEAPGKTLASASPAGERMIDMLKRHEIHVLRRAKHTPEKVAKLAGVWPSSLRRVALESSGCDL